MLSRQNIFLLLSVILICLLSTISVFANPRWVEGTDSTDLTFILADPVRDQVYYGDGVKNKVMIIDSRTETVTGEMQVNGRPLAADISRDGMLMAVAHSGLSIIDLGTLEVIPLSPGLEIVDVAFDHRGKLYVTTTEYWGKIHRVDPASGLIEYSFRPNGRSIYKKAMVETDSTGQFLYVGERGLSPASVYKFDITGDIPVFLAEDDHGAIGSNLKDIAVHENGLYIYLACGAPYLIQEVDANTIDRLNSLDTGPYPNSVVIDPTGTLAYAGTSSTYNAFLYKFDLSTKTLVSKESFLKEMHNDSLHDEGLAIDRTGEKVFAMTGDDHPSYLHWKIQVLTEAPPPDVTPPVVSISATPELIKKRGLKKVPVLIDGSASDAESGLASLVFTVEDDYGIVEPTFYSFGEIYLEPWVSERDIDGRKFTITVVATDNAGNTAESSTEVIVYKNKYLEYLD